MEGENKNEWNALARTADLWDSKTKPEIEQQFWLVTQVTRADLLNFLC